MISFQTRQTHHRRGEKSGTDLDDGDVVLLRLCVVFRVHGDFLDGPLLFQTAVQNQKIFTGNDADGGGIHSAPRIINQIIPNSVQFHICIRSDAVYCYCYRLLGFRP